MSSFDELDLAFNTGTPKFIICPIGDTLPYQSTRGGTYIYPWFSPETEKAGGFFVPVNDDDFEAGRGRPSPPAKKLKKFGKFYKTSRHTRTQPTGEVLKGYYCLLGRLKPSNTVV